jgi:hypothetical protein
VSLSQNCGSKLFNWTFKVVSPLSLSLYGLWHKSVWNCKIHYYKYIDVFGVIISKKGSLLKELCFICWNHFCWIIQMHLGKLCNNICLTQKTCHCDIIKIQIITHAFTPKKSIHNSSFEIYVQNFKLCDGYYFVTNIFHLCSSSSMFVGF